jgi:hypothetical protein
MPTPRGTGHFFISPYRGFYRLSPHSTVAPSPAWAGGRVVFPRRGEGRGEILCEPPTALPPMPGKNKGGERPGVSWPAWFRPYPPGNRPGTLQGVYKMYTNQKRFYTPRFSEVTIVSVRRLAWSLGVTMPKAVERVVNALPSIFPSSAVCPSCRDNTKCAQCAFGQQSAAVPADPTV